MQCRTDRTSFLTTTSTARPGACALALLAAALLSPTPARAASPWRFWTKADGLKQTNVFGVTADGAGHVLIKSSDASVASFDGYQIVPRMTTPGYDRLLVSSNDNEVWTFDAAGIAVHDASGLHEYPDRDIAEFVKRSSIFRSASVAYSYYRGPEDRIDVAPFGKGWGVIMFPDRLVEWNRVTGRKRVIRLASQTGLGRFRDLEQSLDGNIWVSGATGLARLKHAAAGSEWTEFPTPRPLTDLVNPMDGIGGEVFVSAQRPEGKRVLARFAEGKWTEVFTGSGTQLKGWRGPGGNIWVQDERRILELGGQPLHDLGGGRDITGLTTAVVSRPDDSFWLGTTEGVARYTPSLWQTSPELGWADTLVSAIAGDNEGRTWFVSGRYLAVNEHGMWRRFPLPSGRRAALLMEKIVILANGDIAMRAGSLADLVVFHPASGEFRLVQHPDGKGIGWITQRRRGNIWAQVFEKDGIHWTLESFDGTRFVSEGHPYIDSQFNLRAMLDARNGDIWLGSGSTLGRIHEGKYQTLGRKQGFADAGVFSFLEKPNGHILLGGRESLTEYDGNSFHVVRSADLYESMALGADGTIWAASGSGIHRFVPDPRGGGSHWLTNTADDGLPSTAVRKIYADAAGRVWAGTSRGISMFHPEADPDPPVTKIIEDRNLRETPPGGEVRLTFSGADKWKFTAPDRLTFSWRLDGAAWSRFRSSQFVSFQGLRSGSHTFEVRAMDRNGNIDPSPARYEFSVLFPWYLEKQFLILAALAVSVIFWLSRMAWLHHRKLAWQSRHDPLTRLANRNAFEANFNQALTDARGSKTGVAMLLLDLDRFKPVNDTLGHAAGDTFLREVSGRLRAVVRKQDTLARLGGDEFAILMPAIVTRLEAEAMAKKVLHELRQPYYIESYELSGSASVGVSLFPEHGEDAATLHRLADLAMYQCKAQSKDDYAVFDPDSRHIDFRSAQMAGLIREALENGYFELHYQPLTTIEGELSGLEALVRLQHPRFGLLAPNDFISVAEGTGLIVPLGDWVLREACRQAAVWHRAGFRGARGLLKIGVNVSAVQLVRKNFADTVRSALRDSGIDPRALVLELTESAFVQDLEESRSQIEKLRSMGITIALDDFGTGYSSLSSLHLLPIDCIKIDMSFIRRIGEGPRGLALIAKVVELGHEFGLEVVAEGVESDEQLAGLRSVGCDGLQGYLLGRPQPADSTRTMLEESSRVGALT
jgi:diguanylate cyclase (GGDEF)-like protein